MVAVFLLGTGYFFLYEVFLTGTASMDEPFKSMGVLLLIVCPIITMRLFAAEYSGRTMELLSTLPLKPWQIVLGKYLGAVTMLLLMTVGTMVNLIPLYMYGNPETTTILSGYIGFILVGMTCLAVGQFFSALTRNQVIGHLYSFQSAVILQKLFGYLSFSLHFGDFVAGLVRSEAVVYYLVVSAMALTLNASYLQWRR